MVWATKPAGHHLTKALSSEPGSREEWKQLPLDGLIFKPILVQN